MLCALTLVLGCGPPASDVRIRPEAIVAGALDTTHVAVGHVGVLRDGMTELTCSGALVGARTVLTAAHCFIATGATNTGVCSDPPGSTNPTALCDPRLQVAVYRDVAFVLGCDDTNTCDLVDGVNSFRATSYVLHPSYNPRALQVPSRDRDLAVVLLNDAPKGIPPMAVQAQPPALEAPMTLVGYGVTATDATNWGTRRSGETTVVGVFEDVPWFRTEASELHPASSCYGDSGGPALVQEGEQEAVVGVMTHLVAAACGVGAWICAVDVPWLLQVAQGDVVLADDGEGSAPDAGLAAADAGLADADAGLADADAGLADADAGVPAVHRDGDDARLSADASATTFAAEADAAPPRDSSTGTAVRTAAPTDVADRGSGCAASSRPHGGGAGAATLALVAWLAALTRRQRATLRSARRR